MMLMRRFAVCISVIFATLGLNVVQAAPADILFQVATVGALSQGVFDGDFTYAQLAKRGNQGIGTFLHLDGEMIALDGEFYRIDARGMVSHVRADEIVPFAQIVHSDPGFRERIKSIDNFRHLTKLLLKNFNNQNIPYAIRIDGLFKKIKLRSLRKQETPYPSLEQAAEKQAIFEYHDLEGTLIGFWFPSYWAGIAVPGLHLHFIDKNRKGGGHVLEVAIKQGVTSLQAIHQMDVYMPSTGTFSRANLSADNINRSIAKAEGDGR